MGIGCNERLFTSTISGSTSDQQYQEVGTYTFTLDCTSDIQTLTVRNDSRVSLRLGFITSLVGGTPLKSSRGASVQPTPPKLPAAGAGGAAGLGIPVGGMAALGCLLLAAGYASLRRR